MSVNFTLKNQMLQLDAAKKKEFALKVSQERQMASRDIEEKYRADMVSFEAMFKRLEIEKQKNRDLESKLKKIQQPALQQ